MLHILLLVLKIIGIIIAAILGILVLLLCIVLFVPFRYEIKVCISDRCKNKGGTDVLKEFQRILKIRPGQVTRDGRFLLTTVYCMHYCTKAPNVQIGDKLFQNVSVSDVPSIIKKYSAS